MGRDMGKPATSERGSIARLPVTGVPANSFQRDLFRLRLVLILLATPHALVISPALQGFFEAQDE